MGFRVDIFRKLSFLLFLCLISLTIQAKGIDPARKADQKALDSLLVPAVKAVPHLSSYLSSYFTLAKGQFPHQLKF